MYCTYTGGPRLSVLLITMTFVILGLKKNYVLKYCDFPAVQGFLEWHLVIPINKDLLHYLHNFVKYRKILLLYVHTYAFSLTWIYCIPTIRLWSAQCSNKNIVWYISKYHICLLAFYCLCTLYAVPKKFQNRTMRITIITV